MPVIVTLDPPATVIVFAPDKLTITKLKLSPTVAVPPGKNGIAPFIKVAVGVVIVVPPPVAVQVMTPESKMPAAVMVYVAAPPQSGGAVGML